MELFGRKKDEKEESTNWTITKFVLITAFVYILLGVSLLFIPQIELITLCYILCAVLVITGIILIVRYFLTDAYRNINEYGFCLGVFFVILGMCALVRAEQVAESFILCAGMALLMTSVIKLQNALDLKHLEEKTWSVMLGISLGFLVCSVLIIINPFKNPSTVKGFTYRILIIDGVISLISNLFLFLKIKQYKKKETKILDEKESDRTEDLEPVSFEEENKTEENENSNT